MPGKIIGPSIRTESAVSVDFCKKLLTGEMSAVPYRCFPVVDVRDVALAHLQAIKVPEARNRRFFSVNQSVWFRDLCEPVATRFNPEGWPVTTTLEQEPENFDSYIN